MTCFQNRRSHRINKVSRVFISHLTGLSSEFINVAKYSHPTFSFFSKEFKEMLSLGEGSREGEKTKTVRIKSLITTSIITEDKRFL